VQYGVSPLQKVGYDAQAERELFLQIPRNAIGGVTRTAAQAQAARRMKFQE
jgi:hypothetical protein